MTEFVQISTTIDSEPAAKAIGAALVERRLAACVQVLGPVRSIYRWQGAVQEAEEWLCLVKTRAVMFPRVEAAIREMHSYECPEIFATPIADGAAAYLHWLDDQLN